MQWERYKRTGPAPRLGTDFVIHPVGDLWYKSRVRVLTILVSLPPLHDAPSPAQRAALVCDRLESMGRAEVPISWHLPAHALAAGDGPDHDARVAERLLARVSGAGDRIVPMGLTGAPHAALHVEEIAADTEWAVANLWNRGVRDTLGTDPPLVLPAGAETLRRDALVAYGRSAVPIGLLVDAADGTWITIVPNGDGVPGRALPLITLDTLLPTDITRRSLARELGRRERAARGTAALGRDAAVVAAVTVRTADDVDRAVALVDAAADGRERGDLDLSAIDPDRAGEATPRALRVEIPIVTTEASVYASSLRQRRGSRINTRRVLEAIAGDPPDEPPEPPATAPPEGRREFVASMMGRATVAGTVTSAHFVGGRLCGLHGPGFECREQHAARSYAVTAGGYWLDDLVESCFSFESEISRGVRSESVIGDEESGLEARISAEYSLVGDADALVMTHQVAVVGSVPGCELRVVAAPLVQRERCAVTGRFTDGSTYDVEIDWSLPEVVLAADAFQIWDGESRYTYVPLTWDGRPRTSTIALTRDPEPRVVLAGRYPLAYRANHVASGLLVRGELDDDLVVRALAGRLPSSFATEIAAGVASEAAMPAPATGRREA